ncbi:MAG: hypothetical protein ACOH1E_11200 [Brevundimonas sp.]
MEVFGWVQAWILNHFGLIAGLLFPVWVLLFFLPGALVSVIGDRLPDAETGYRKSDAVPYLPSAHVRSWAFLYGRRGMEVSGPTGRWLIRLIRLATVVVYVSLFAIFIASATDGYVFDPNADILKSDMQRFGVGDQ